MCKGALVINTFYHNQSAARKWGGQPEDYSEINGFIDSSKRIIGDIRHRSIYHHTEGIFLCERLFGEAIALTPAPGTRGTKLIPVRLIAERHILEDLGWIPSPADYIKAGMELAPWMSGSVRKTVPLSHILGGNNV